ncbi:acyltransferase family protein [Flavobacterium sp.]|uniref:acyltransferase n=1 Tax=Flavobacterium sp. TaxID=239 RepID=UPI0026222043|nr:acyltransferase family protein [Flavobacterium sp.]MDG2433715.1 acyltransferase family protein [Flavobacterium sp.]
MKHENISCDSKFGLSFLRIIATFSVIVIHVAGPLVVRFSQIPNFEWHVANFYDSVSRYSVPVFFMISGALILRKDYELFDFLKRRFGKIIIPFLFWSLLYSLLNRYVFNDDSFSVVKIIRDVFYGSMYHLWFVYALLGVYLTVPVLRRWIKNAPQKEILYVLIIWMITIMLTIPKLNIYFPKIDFIYFSGFIGYFILGYYLSLFKFPKKLSLILIFLGSLITIVGTYYFTEKNSKFYYYFYEYLCLNTLMVSSGFFLLFNRIQCNKPKIKSFMLHLNGTCFGIYLMHPLLLQLFELIGFNVNITNSVISILLIAFTCFLVCGGVVFSIKKLKYGHLIT